MLAKESEEKGLKVYKAKTEVTVLSKRDGIIKNLGRVNIGETES